MCPRDVQPFIFTKDKIVFEEYKRQAELARLQTYYMMSAQTDLKKAGIRKPSDLIPYTWDKQPVIVINASDYTLDKFEELDSKYC